MHCSSKIPSSFYSSSQRIIVPLTCTEVDVTNTEAECQDYTGNNLFDNSSEVNSIEHGMQSRYDTIK